MSQPEIRITIVARNARGSIADVKRWAEGLDQGIRDLLEKEGGPELEIISLGIEKKLEGHEKIV